jgi:pectate lyase
MLKASLAALTVLALLSSNLCATTILDDTFADGTRNNQNLPTDAAWYVSSSSSWATGVGALTVTNGSSAILAVSYFGANSSTPVSLAVGDTLTATIKFTFNGVVAGNTSGGLRIGLFDFADSTLSPKWATADLTSNSGQGTGVAGYALFQSLGATFNNQSPMNLEKRTTTSDASLLGTSGDWTSLGSGPGSTNGFGGFVVGTQYSLQLSVTRSNSTALVISATWQNVASPSSTLIWSVVDTSATSFNFDGIGFRPSSAATTATNITINEVRMDYNSAGSPASVSFSSSDVSAYVGQNANFSVVAGGTAPLFYQWYFNTNTILSGATNSTLTLTNAQTSNSGAYFCIVTNSFGSDTSDVAQLTVTVPVAPTILAQPQNLTVLPGASASFSVSAGGSTPLNFQWYFNTNTLIAGATSSTLTINNVQATNIGTYSVTVNNLAGSTNSAFANLTLNNTPVAPSFVSQPPSLVLLAGSTASFSASASGTVPIFYQWLKNNSPISGATNTTLTLTNVQNADAATYALVASNSVSTVTSSNATLTITVASSLPFSAFNLTGFGHNATGGGMIAETNSAYVKVTNALDFANALISAYKTAGSVKVIEITTNLDLGWNEIGSTVQNLASTPFRSHNTPLLHPRLLQTGVSLIDIKPRSGLTIFSANGVTIRHATFNVKGCANIIIRNLKFDEMWEWDEATKGQYDKNDWDFIDLGNGGSVSNVWIDHCTFTKTYDGILDTKAGCSGITISWCKYTGDDGATNANSFVWQQINSLESNRTSYAFYNFLRNNGFSPTDIVTIIQGHDKTHLAGANDLDPNNATLSMTFHHLWLNNVWDRCVPRLRAGNVHDYNIYADDTLALAAKNLRNAKAALMSTNNQNTLNNTYDFDPPLNGAISTEGGALLVEKSVYLNDLWPLRNNQTDPSNPAYTGKIQALDTIYTLNATTVRGNSTDAGNPMGPFQATVIPFSWNLPGNVLPYTYTLDDPSQLQNIVAAGAGAGIVNWNKTNWLATTYAATAPTITAQPQNQTVAPSNSVTFTVVASGSANLFYQWYFNTNTILTGATNASLSLNNVASTNAGTYSVIVTNSAGSVTSSVAVLTISSGTHAKPQLASVAFSNGNFSISVAGDSGVDYIVQASTNLVDWNSIFTNHAATPPFNWSDTGATNFNRRYYRVLLGQ